MVLGLSPLTWVAVLVVLVIVIYLIGTWPYNEFKKRNLVHPKPTFLVGNMGPFATSKLSAPDQSMYYYNMYKEHRAFGFFNFLRPNVYVNDLEVIKLIAVKDFDYFTNHIPFVPEGDTSLMGKILFSMKDNHWRWMRNTLTPAFTSSKMKSMFSLVTQCGEQLKTHLANKCKAEKDGIITVDTKNLYTRFANDVIATTAFGLQCDSLKDEDNDFFKMGKSATDFSGIQAFKFFLFEMWPSVVTFFNITLVSKYVNDYFTSIVKNTLRVREKENIIRPDMIHLLMEARKGILKNDSNDVTEKRHNVGKETFELTDEDIAAQAFIFFVAAFDTSSTLLCFLSHLLAVHPDIQDRVRQEIDDVLAEDSGKLTYDGIVKMKYLDQTVSEALRLYPPLPDIDRICSRDYTVPASGSSPSIKFKKGDGVFISAFGIHRDPEYFPDPDRFDPDRFSDENKHKIKPFTYMPFGLGPRACIGNRFALMEAKIAIVSIMSRFTLEVVSKTPSPLRFEKNTFNTHAEGGFWLGIKPRT